MNAFHDVSLPEALARAVRGGPVDATEIIAFGAGREARLQSRTRLRRRYDIALDPLGPAEAYALLGFYEARRGRLFAFRLRDPVDHRSCDPLTDPGPLDQAIGVGDGAAKTFALVKTYSDSGGASGRAVALPVSGSVRVSVGGAELPATGFVCDASGRVTLSAAPAPGALVRAGFLFDTPVRFEAARLDLPLAGHGGARGAATVALVEADV